MIYEVRNLARMHAHVHMQDEVEEKGHEQVESGKERQGKRGKEGARVCAGSPTVKNKAR